MALHRFVFIACLVGLVLPACTQDEDEACQVPSDCADGLTCFIATGSLRGTCVSPEDVRSEEDAGTPDAGDETVDADVSVRDGSADDDAG